MEKEHFRAWNEMGRHGRERISRPPRSTAPAPLRTPRIADSAGGRNRGGRSLSGPADTKIAAAWGRREAMPAIGAKRVGVIGAGMVGVCAASWLQRDGHSVFLVETDEPGRGASFGNAGCFNGSSVTPVAMPGVMWNVPRWLFDPLAPLALRWSYLPAIAPWLLRFMRAGTPEKARAAARALRPLVGPTLEALKPLVSAAGAEDLVHRLGHLYVYRLADGPQKDRLAWDLRRENGVEIDEFDADELRQLEPALSRDYVRGVLVRENGHTLNPLALVERLVGHFVRSGGELVALRWDQVAARCVGLRPGQYISRRGARGTLPQGGGRLPHSAPRLERDARQAPRRPVISNTADIGSGTARSLCQNPVTVHCVRLQPPSVPSEARGPPVRPKGPRIAIPPMLSLKASRLIATEVRSPAVSDQEMLKSQIVCGRGQAK